MLPHLTCACRHWHFSCGKCSAGSTVSCYVHKDKLKKTVYKCSKPLTSLVHCLKRQRLAHYCDSDVTKPQLEYPWTVVGCSNVHAPVT